ncbi:NUDIX domain-containing protein [Listeria costaricensis]|uniref:NUDIX domain-containing protein n=1 Tax=Listeria costaricensis TaxID=2026604 RepID=UPI000C08D094|nr:NUDIX domain-containing protein [Listeria costaricensis]
MRQPENVLVIPFIKKGDVLKVAVFYRRHSGYCQFVAGGLEDQESHLHAARREFFEETGQLRVVRILPLKTEAFIPKSEFADFRDQPDVEVVHAVAFGFQLAAMDFILSKEHRRIEWVTPSEAVDRLTFAFDREALRELLTRI